MKNIIKIAFIALFGIVLTSCGTSSSPKSGEAVAKITINGGAGMTAIVKESDPFSLKADTIKLGGDGSFVFSENLNGLTYYTVSLKEARTQFSVIMLPGDTLFLSADMNDIFASQKFSGNGAVYNNYLVDYTNTSNNFQQAIRTIFAKPESIAMAAVDSVRKSNEQRLATLENNNSDIDATFEKIEKARILYEYAILHAIYPMYYEYFTKSTFEPSADFDSYLGELDLNDESLLSLGIYKAFLSTHINVKMDAFYKDSALQATSPSAVVYQLNLIKSNFTSPKTIELLSFDAVMNHVTQNGISEYNQYIDLFKELCPNDYFQSQIEDIVGEWKYLQKGADAFEFTFVDMDGNKVSMSDFKGKYVYIDVWATWCNPCRAEIPHLKRIEEEFHGKNIVFISVSVDQTQDPWRKMVTDDEMKGVQLWAGQAPEFSEFYKITGIPRFMLFDKEGKIYDINAKRPSGGIEDEIKALPGL